MIVKRRKSVFLTAASKQVQNGKTRHRRTAKPHFSRQSPYREKKAPVQKRLWVLLGAAGVLLAAVLLLWMGRRLSRQAADPVGLLAWGAVLAIVLAIGAAVFFSICKQKKDRNGTQEPSHSRYMRVKGTFGQMQEHVYRKNTRLRR